MMGEFWFWLIANKSYNSLPFEASVANSLLNITSTAISVSTTDIISSTFRRILILSVCAWLAGVRSPWLPAALWRLVLRVSTFMIYYMFYYYNLLSIYKLYWVAWQLIIILRTTNCIIFNNLYYFILDLVNTFMIKLYFLLLLPSYTGFWLVDN